MSATILIVDDEENILKSLSGILEDEGYRTIHACDGIEALEVAQRESPDLVMLDIWMPRMEGLETLQRLKEADPSLIVVMMSGHGTIETAVKSTKMGAYDFIEKPLSLDKVIVTVKNALGVSRLRRENASLRSLILKDDEIIGKSREITLLREQILMAATASAPVLLTGENGAGKEFAARSIHLHSPRREGPFVEINCAAIPEDLIDLEFFGHEKGQQFTSHKKGKFDFADGGTVFLKEIADISIQTQIKLLRMLAEGKFERVGGTRRVEVDVRVIASTRRLLKEEIKLERFNEDLYYRLNVVPFHLPPLRERKEDIPLLVGHFLEIFCQKEGHDITKISVDALEKMASYHWPGNVRELRNLVERLVILNPGQSITGALIPEYISGKGSVRRDEAHADGSREAASLREAREEFEKEFILQKLEDNDWNIARTADAIELERSILQRKIKAYGINLGQ